MSRQSHRPQGKELQEGLRERWRPIHAGDAFQRRTPLTRRLIAQALHYEQVRRAQRLAAGLATGATPPEGEALRAAAQHNALYSDLPTRFAAQAAVGHSAYLEYRARTQGDFAATAHDPERAAALGDLFQVRTPQERTAFGLLLTVSTEAVATRLCLHAMGREEGLGAVEHYRVYLATQAKLPPTSITDLIRLTLVLGDLLGPALEDTIRDVHPLLVGPIAAATSVSRVMEAQLAGTPKDELTARVQGWVEAMVIAIAPFVMPAVHAPPRSTGVQPPAPSLFPENPDAPPRRIEEILEEAAAALTDPQEASPDPTRSLQNEVRKVLKAANEEASLKQDPRPDRVQDQACAKPFQEGELQGNPSGVALVEDILGGDSGYQKSMVFHEVLVPPEDASAWHALRRETRPLVAQLRRLLYPSLVTRLERVRHRTSGAPDPRRLALYPFSDTIYQQHRQERLPAPSSLSRSVVLLACDGSGSMGEPEIRVLKLLTCAFVESLVGARGIQLLAGAYNSGPERSLRGGAPKVHWLHHPKLTPGRTPLEAGRAIAAFPDTGTGRNHDTISLSYMLDEAIDLARGGTCYLVNLTDTRFNSPISSRSGSDVMEDFLREAKALEEISLDYTLVAIGAPEGYSLKGADAVLSVPPEDLKDSRAIASRVAHYVTESIAARRAELEGRRPS
ncbi:MAG: vWA domain-containing protein [Pseudomonadota bacterium]